MFDFENYMVQRFKSLIKLTSSFLGDPRWHTHLPIAIKALCQKTSLLPLLHAVNGDVHCWNVNSVPHDKIVSSGTQSGGVDGLVVSFSVYRVVNWVKVVV